MADSGVHLNPPIFLRLCSYARYRANVLENGGFKSIGGKPTDGGGAGGRVFEVLLITRVVVLIIIHSWKSGINACGVIRASRQY